jgi:hypothetical protein
MVSYLIINIQNIIILLLLLVLLLVLSSHLSNWLFYILFFSLLSLNLFICLLYILTLFSLIE